ncbi:MAG TPA: hypothetical protein PLP86_07455 [Armatimonadota bacterium]|nr:hypothetical protein [Armatimonadota bacterium]HOM72067.1 hypothetical protein [Armatimonadota bacterium]
MAESMTTEQQVAEKTMEAEKRGMERVREGEPTKALLEAGETAPSTLYAYLAGASVLLSAILFFTRKSKDWSLFIGQWAPTFLALGLFTKLLKPSKEQPQM